MNNMTLDKQYWRDRLPLFKPSINLSEYITLLSKLPNWLVQKLQLFPDDTIGVKLTNLREQIRFLVDGYNNMEVVDIEDHYMDFGMSLADITVLTKDGDYMFVDLTTSKARTLHGLKKTNLMKQMESLGVEGVCEVHVIYDDQIIFDYNRRTPVNFVDNFCQFVSSQSYEDRQYLKVALADKEDALAEWTLSQSWLDAPVDKPGLPIEKLSAHPVDWSDVLKADELRSEFEEALSFVKVPAKPSLPFKVPFPVEAPISVSWDDVWAATDPLVSASLIAMILPKEFRGKVLAVKRGFPIRSCSRSPLAEDRGCWRQVVPDSGSNTYFNGIKKKSNTPFHILTNKLDMYMEILVSEEVVTLSEGSLSVEHPVGFDCAINNTWTGYGARVMRKSKEDKAHAGKHFDDFQTLTWERVQQAQIEHDKQVNFFSSESDTISVYASKVYDVSKLCDLHESDPYMLRSLKRNSLQTKFMEYVDVLYHFAKSVSVVMLQGSHKKYSYSLFLTRHNKLLCAMPSTVSLATMINVPVSMWCKTHQESPLLQTNRTESFDKRLLEWYVRYPSLYLLRCAESVQYSKFSQGDSIRNCVEMVLCSAQTTQQQSAMKDNVRYVYAAAVSYEPDLFGPLKKLKGAADYGQVSLMTDTMVVYYARLARVQVTLYLYKSMGNTSFLPDKESPPQIPLPCDNYIRPTWADYTDGFFDSKLFNKEKSNKASPCAIIWADQLQSYIDFRDLKTSVEEEAGMSTALMGLIQECYEANSIHPLIWDIEHGTNGRSVFAESAKGWWRSVCPERNKARRWNAAASMIIFASHLPVVTQAQMLKPLIETPISELLKNKGACPAYKDTDDFVGKRKSTVVLHGLLKFKYKKELHHSDVGLRYVRHAMQHYGEHESLLLYSLIVMAEEGKYPVVGRTEDKNQTGKQREFSPMNAVGIVSCSATEAMNKCVSKECSNDSMLSTNDERDFTNIINDKEEDSATLDCAADCSAYGPNQIAEKNMVMTMIQLTSVEGSVLLLYDLIVESWRLMKTKISKIPYALHEHMKKHGKTYESMSKEEHSSAFKAVGRLGLEAFKGSNAVGFVHRYGMYMGVLGISSSLAQSTAHKFITYCMVKAEYSARATSIVTNDDSLIRALGVKRYTLKHTSLLLKSLISEVFGYIGMVLSLFKTIVSTKLSEFHSHFGQYVSKDNNGILANDIRHCFPMVIVASGENMSTDSMAPIFAGMSCLRKGVSLYMSTWVSICSTILFMDQYNRWSSFRNIFGCKARPPDLGGPVAIDLVGTVALSYLPYMDWWSRLVSDDPDDIMKVSRAVAKTRVLQFELDEEMQQTTGMSIIGSNIRSATYKRLSTPNKVVKEIRAVPGVWCLPLPGTTSLQSLTMLNVGIAADSLVTPKSALIRFARTQVNRTIPNFMVAAGSMLHHKYGKSMVSYVDIDSYSFDDFMDYADHDSHLAYPGFVDALSIMDVALRTTKVWGSSNNMLKVIMHKEMYFVEKRFDKIVGIIGLTSKASSQAPFTIIDKFGSDKLKARFKDESRGAFTMDNVEGMFKEYKSTLAASNMVKKVVQLTKGHFQISVKGSLLAVTPKQLAGILCTRAISGCEAAFEVSAYIDSRTTNFYFRQPYTLVTANICNLFEQFKSGQFIGEREVTAEPSELRDVLNQCERDWYSLEPGFKFKHKIIMSRMKGYIMITNWYPGKFNRYVHFVLHVTKPHTVFDELGVTLSPGEFVVVNSKGGATDTYVAPCSTLTCRVTRTLTDTRLVVEGDYTIYAGLARHLCEHEGELTLEPVDREPTKADAQVFASQGVLDYGMFRMKTDEMMEPADFGYISDSCIRFGSHDLLNAMLYRPLPPHWQEACQVVYNFISRLEGRKEVNVELSEYEQNYFDQPDLWDVQYEEESEFSEVNPEHVIKGEEYWDDEVATKDLGGWENVFACDDDEDEGEYLSSEEGSLNS